ncbi:MAG TPA: SRPBCC domain-containing protein [Chitinophaga sp.]
MKDYKNHYVIMAPPEEVYRALVTPATIRLWTGEEAVMSEEPGSEFSMWEEAISGRNLEFEEPRKIVQEWYFGDHEPASIVTLLLHPHKKGTSLELRHTNIPDEDFTDIVEGWNEVYMASLRDFYA